MFVVMLLVSSSRIRSSYGRPQAAKAYLDEINMTQAP